MKDRTIICEYYVAHGECTKGKDANLQTTCVHCTKYKKKRGVSPWKVDTRKKKLDKARKREDF